ncbi:MAG: hypothetical protein WCY26_01710 [Thiohalobacteraceae bacterium]
MVKVYDMVTYEVDAAGDELSVIQNSPARSTGHTDLCLAIGLSPSGHAPPRREDPLPPSMRGVDITAFLADIDAS